MQTQLLINIHGFLSSHASEKVAELQAFIDTHAPGVAFTSPCLPDHPQEAVTLLDDLIQQQSRHYDRIGLIGHSLGGYYATYLASRHHLKAVLVNPVVRGYDIMCEFYGEVHNPHSGRDFVIGEADIDYLFRIYLDTLPDTSLFLVLLQLADDIVDPSSAQTYYQGCEVIVEAGGSHDFDGLVRHGNRIINFLLDEQSA